MMLTAVRATAVAIGALVAVGSIAAAQGVDAVGQALCGTRAECRVVARSDAGRDAAGRALTVVEIGWPDTNGNNRECMSLRRQVWLLAGGEPPRRVLELCNDGYGAAGIGEDELTVGPNTLTHARSGGSAWRWSIVRTIQLSPLAVLRSEGDGWWTVGPNREDRTWDWTRLAGRRSWWSPPCLPAGQTLSDEEGEAPSPLPFEYAPIPRAAAEAMPAGALQAELGSCAFQVDAGGATGFVLRGRADPAAAAREYMRILAIGDRDVLITVGSGPWRTGAANWIHDDHLELWMGQLGGYIQHCIGRETSPSQWGIRIGDGRVFQGAGPGERRPEVVARRERRAGSARIVTFHLRLPPDTHAFTAVLARGDGRRQGRMVATARVRFGEASSLGSFEHIPAAALRCAVRDGRLDIVESGRAEMLIDEP